MSYSLVLKGFSIRFTARRTVTENSLLMAYYRNQHRKIVSDWTLDTTRSAAKIPEGFVIAKGANGEALMHRSVSGDESIH